MPDNAELDRLYAETKSALKKREYDRAAGLLTQILVIDENYKDVPRLLAQTVKLKRRRWYSHPALWSALGLILLIGLGIWLSKVLSRSTATTTLPVESTVMSSMTVISATATVTLMPTATRIPLTWKRISMGLEFERDTVTAFATDKKDPDVIYAGMKNSGVYKTIDGGLSWRPAHNGLASTQVESLLIDSQDPQVLYAGTMGGVFKTENGGENWYRIGDGTYLLMDLQDNSHLYARDENGIYETKDQGNIWTTVYVLGKDCPDAVSSWAIHPTDGNMLFIGGGKTCAGVYQSSDGGHGWTLIGMKDYPNLDALAIGLYEQGNYSIFARFPSTTGFRWDTVGWHVSHDGGATWSIVSACGGILLYDPDRPSTMYCGDESHLYIVNVRGNSPQAIPNTESMVYTAIHVDHPNGMNRIIIGATDVSKSSYPIVGIFISEDGGNSWIQKNNGLGSIRTELKIDPLNSAKIYLATYFPDISVAGCRLYRSQDKGESWLVIKPKGGDWCGPIFGAANALYLNEGGKLQQSRDNGDTWLWDQQELARDSGPNDPSLVFALPNYYRDGRYFEGSQSISANPYSEGLVYDVGNVIWYSTDAGTSWQQSAGSEGSWDGRLFYTNQSKMIFDIGRYHQKYSTDNGKTWQNCGMDVIASRSDTRLTLDLQGSRLYLATPGQGVMISTDKCGSWQPSNNGLTNLFVNTLAIDPNNSNTIYAGTDGGAYISYDSGATWGQVNDGLLGATVVYSIAVDKDSNVYAATPYGIFKLENR